MFFKFKMATCGQYNLQAETFKVQTCDFFEGLWHEILPFAYVFFHVVHFPRLPGT